MNSRFRIIRAATIILLIATIFSCAKRTTGSAPQEKKTSSFPANRIASMAPSSTVILSKLGLADRLVAVDAWSGEIEGVPPSAVRFDMMSPDIERITALEPELLIVSSMTEAGTGLDPFKPVADAGIRVISLRTSSSIAGISDDVMTIARAVGKESEGTAMVSALKDEISRIRKISDTIPQSKRKTVYFEISPAPWIYSFGSGVYLDDVLQAAGLINVLADEQGWIAVSAETIAAKNPDVILTNIADKPDPVAEILGRTGWGGISAVKNKQVYRIDAATSSQPTPDIVLAAREIAKDVYPEYFK